MNWRKAIGSICMWGLAPIGLRLFFNHTDVLFSLAMILFFASIPILFQRRVYHLNIRKIFRPIVILSGFTLIHYLGNFYGILYGNIILTALIVKNSPFFQKIFFIMFQHKKPSPVVYISGLIFALGIFLSSYTANDNSSINIHHIMYPLISSITWAGLMVYLSKGREKELLLAPSNMVSSLAIFIIFLVQNKFSFEIFQSVSRLQYSIYAILGIFPTCVAPILWSSALRNIGERMIFLDYITPTITIIASTIIFDTQLNYINIIGFSIIAGSIALQNINRNKNKCLYNSNHITLTTNDLYLILNR